MSTILFVILGVLGFFLLVLLLVGSLFLLYKRRTSAPTRVAVTATPGTATATTTTSWWSTAKGYVMAPPAFMLPSLVALGIIVVLIIIGLQIFPELMRTIMWTGGFNGVVIAIVLGALLLHGKFVKTYILLVLLVILSAIIVADRSNIKKVKQYVTTAQTNWDPKAPAPETLEEKVARLERKVAAENTTAPTAAVTPVQQVVAKSRELPESYGWFEFTAPCDADGMSIKIPTDYACIRNPDGTFSNTPDHPERVGKYRFVYGTFNPNEHAMIVPNGKKSKAKDTRLVAGHVLDAEYFQFYSQEGPVRMFGGYTLRTLPPTTITPQYLQFRRENSK